MNTDGGIFKETNLVGIGAIVRNQTGHHMASLAANIGYATNTTAELRAIRDGLLLLLNVGIRSIHLKSDSLIVVQMINRKQAMRVVHQALLRDILNLVKLMDDVWLQFSFRETNYTADKLVTVGKNNPYMYNIFLDSPPAWLMESLAHDVNSVLTRTSTCVVISELLHL